MIQLTLLRPRPSGPARAPPVDFVVVGGQVLPEGPARKCRDFGVQHVRKIVNPAFPYQPDRLGDLAWRNLIQGASLVAVAISGRPPASSIALPMCGLCVRHHAILCLQRGGTFHDSLVFALKAEKNPVDGTRDSWVTDP